LSARGLAHAAVVQNNNFADVPEWHSLLLNASVAVWTASMTAVIGDAKRHRTARRITVQSTPNGFGGAIRPSVLDVPCGEDVAQPVCAPDGIDQPEPLAGEFSKARISRRPAHADVGSPRIRRRSICEEFELPDCSTGRHVSIRVAPPGGAAVDVLVATTDDIGE
jgi:hypothetical protein